MNKIFLIFLLSMLAFSGIAQTNISDMKEFKKVSWEDLNDNAIRLIGNDWMLISAGSVDTDFNMMTASWGGLGWLWEKPVSFIFVRPQRHTFKFVEREEYYTITFYKEEYRLALKKMGSVSGRNFDKMHYEGLTAIKTENNSVAFKEAYIVIECKKSYSTVIQEDEFIDQDIVSEKYPNKDFHTMYVGEIVNVWMKEEMETKK